MQLSCAPPQGEGTDASCPLRCTRRARSTEWWGLVYNGGDWLYNCMYERGSVSLKTIFSKSQAGKNVND